VKCNSCQNFINYFKKLFIHCHYIYLQHFTAVTVNVTIFENMLTITNHTLEKLEILLKTAGYRVRYEKGNFKTGACMLLSSRVIVVNKFANLESKIAAVAELARTLEVDYNLLDDKQAAFLHQLKQTTLQL
jgi:hypothetical protein